MVFTLIFTIDFTFRAISSQRYADNFLRMLRKDRRVRTFGFMRDIVGGLRKISLLTTRF